MAKSKTAILLAGKEVELKYRDSSTARLQSLKGGAPAGKDFENPKKAFFAVCAWIWAMLPKPLRAEYDAPEDIADAIDLTKLKEYFSAVNAAMEESNPGEAGKEEPSSSPGSA